MPSQNTQWYKDVRLIQYLDQLRQRNYGFMSKCYFCAEKSIGIKAIQEKLYSVCDSHQDKKDDQKSVNDLLASQTTFEE